MVEEEKNHLIMNVNKKKKRGKETMKTWKKLASAALAAMVFAYVVSGGGGQKTFKCGQRDSYRLQNGSGRSER